MTDMEMEFEKLKAQYNAADSYFKTQYQNDPEEKQQKAEAKIKAITDRMGVIWQRIGHKSLELDPDQSTEEWLEQIGKQEFWEPKSIEVYKKRRKVVVKLERPQFWKDPAIKVIDM